MGNKIKTIVVFQDDEESEDQYSIEIDCYGVESYVNLSYSNDPNSPGVVFPFSGIDDIIEGLLFIRKAHSGK